MANKGTSRKSVSKESGPSVSSQVEKPIIEKADISKHSVSRKESDSVKDLSQALLNALSNEMSEASIKDESKKSSEHIKDLCLEEKETVSQQVNESTSRLNASIKESASVKDLSQTLLEALSNEITVASIRDPSRKLSQHINDLCLEEKQTLSEIANEEISRQSVTKKESGPIVDLFSEEEKPNSDKADADISKNSVSRKESDSVKDLTQALLKALSNEISEASMRDKSKTSSEPLKDSLLEEKETVSQQVNESTSRQSVSKKESASIEDLSEALLKVLSNKISEASSRNRSHESSGQMKDSRLKDKETVCQKADEDTSRRSISMKETESIKDVCQTLLKAFSNEYSEASIRDPSRKSSEHIKDSRLEDNETVSQQVDESCSRQSVSKKESGSIMDLSQAVLKALSNESSAASIRDQSRKSSQHIKDSRLEENKTLSQKADECTSRQSTWNKESGLFVDLSMQEEKLISEKAYTDISRHNVSRKESDSVKHFSEELLKASSNEINEASIQDLGRKSSGHVRDLSSKGQKTMSQKEIEDITRYSGSKKESLSMKKLCLDEEKMVTEKADEDASVHKDSKKDASIKQVSEEVQKSLSKESRDASILNESQKSAECMKALSLELGNFLNQETGEEASAYKRSGKASASITDALLELEKLSSSKAVVEPFVHDESTKALASVTSLSLEWQKRCNEETNERFCGHEETRVAEGPVMDLCYERHKRLSQEANEAMLFQKESQKLSSAMKGLSSPLQKRWSRRTSNKEPAPRPRAKKDGSLYTETRKASRPIKDFYPQRRSKMSQGPDQYLSCRRKSFKSSEPIREFYPDWRFKICRRDNEKVSSQRKSQRTCGSIREFYPDFHKKINQGGQEVSVQHDTHKAPGSEKDIYMYVNWQNKISQGASQEHPVLNESPKTSESIRDFDPFLQSKIGRGANQTVYVENDMQKASGSVRKFYPDWHKKINEGSQKFPVHNNTYKALGSNIYFYGNRDNKSQAFPVLKESPKTSESIRDFYPFLQSNCTIGHESDETVFDQKKSRKASASIRDFYPCLQNNISYGEYFRSKEIGKEPIFVQNKSNSRKASRSTKNFYSSLRNKNNGADEEIPARIKSRKKTSECVKDFSLESQKSVSQSQESKDPSVSNESLKAMKVEETSVDEESHEALGSEINYRKELRKISSSITMLQNELRELSKPITAIRKEFSQISASISISKNERAIIGSNGSSNLSRRECKCHCSCCSTCSYSTLLTNTDLDGNGNSTTTTTKSCANVTTTIPERFVSHSASFSNLSNHGENVPRKHEVSSLAQKYLPSNASNPLVDILQPVRTSSCTSKGNKRKSLIVYTERQSDNYNSSSSSVSDNQDNSDAKKPSSVSYGASASILNTSSSSERTSAFDPSLEQVNRSFFSESYEKMNEFPAKIRLEHSTTIAQSEVPVFGGNYVGKRGNKMTGEKENEKNKEQISKVQYLGTNEPSKIRENKSSFEPQKNMEAQVQQDTIEIIDPQAKVKTLKKIGAPFDKKCKSSEKQYQVIMNNYLLKQPDNRRDVADNEKKESIQTETESFLSMSSKSSHEKSLDQCQNACSSTRHLAITGMQKSKNYILKALGAGPLYCFKPQTNVDAKRIWKPKKKLEVNESDIKNIRSGNIRSPYYSTSNTETPLTEDTEMTTTTTATTRTKVTTATLTSPTTGTTEIKEIVPTEDILLYSSFAQDKGDIRLKKKKKDKDAKLKKKDVTYELKFDCKINSKGDLIKNLIKSLNSLGMDLVNRGDQKSIIEIMQLNIYLTEVIPKIMILFEPKDTFENVKTLLHSAAYFRNALTVLNHSDLSRESANRVEYMIKQLLSLIQGFLDASYEHKKSIGQNERILKHWMFIVSNEKSREMFPMEHSDPRIKRIENFCGCEINKLDRREARESRIFPPDGYDTWEINYDASHSKHIGSVNMVSSLFANAKWNSVQRFYRTEVQLDSGDIERLSDTTFFRRAKKKPTTDQVACYRYFKTFTSNIQ